MDVPPHPHIGLQTVTWLFRGEVLHRDGLGSEQQRIRAASQLNLMTAGRGIAHSEESRGDFAAALGGLQLWTALPDEERSGAPVSIITGAAAVDGQGRRRSAMGRWARRSRRRERRRSSPRRSAFTEARRRFLSIPHGSTRSTPSREA
jgi:redox-sensitive bicupin YhaK (pirin superfamily)